ncbi:GNAT family N-acetyltransferase [Pyrococcus yayanosii]|uniref:GNAT family N-acetyltransferase n=1 Tax=Pyrococcus yayanosii TaxID=1008460 RepID=UPI000B05F76D|nr:GNAT family N-acetyltransferase [Pyrococcus yayanosii]
MGCFWVEEVYVRSKFRRRGIERKLVKKVEQEVFKWNSWLYLFVPLRTRMQ